MWEPNNKARLRQRLGEIETLRHRCHWLSAPDRILMQMVFDKGSSLRQIARLTGRSPSTVCRRVNRLLNLLIAREVVAVLRRRGRVDDADIRIVRDYFIQGCSQRMIARRLNLSLYRVRTILQAARSIIDAGTKTPGRTPSKPDLYRYHQSESPGKPRNERR